MKKRTGHVVVWLGAILVAACSPIFVSWACIGMLDEDPRAHYVSGIGQIAGFFGAEDTKQTFIETAKRIAYDRVLVAIPRHSEEEAAAVCDHANLQFPDSIGGLPAARMEKNGSLIFEVSSKDEDAFRRAMTQFRLEYKEAQQVAAE